MTAVYAPKPAPRSGTLLNAIDHLELMKANLPDEDPYYPGPGAFLYTELTNLDYKVRVESHGGPRDSLTVGVDMKVEKPGPDGNMFVAAWRPILHRPYYGKNRVTRALKAFIKLCAEWGKPTTDAAFRLNAGAGWRGGPNVFWP